MQLEHLKKRVEEIFEEVDKELIFKGLKHRKIFIRCLWEKERKHYSIRLIMLPLYFFYLRMKNFGTESTEMCWIPGFTLTG